MAFEQFEIWQMVDDRWDLVATFLNFDTANAIVRNRKECVRLLKVAYDNGAAVSQEVLAEVGSTRQEP